MTLEEETKLNDMQAHEAILREEITAHVTELSNLLAKKALVIQEISDALEQFKLDAVEAQEITDATEAIIASKVDELKNMRDDILSIYSERTSELEVAANQILNTAASIDARTKDADIIIDTAISKAHQIDLETEDKIHQRDSLNSEIEGMNKRLSQINLDSSIKIDMGNQAYSELLKEIACKMDEKHRLDIEINNRLILDKPNTAQADKIAALEQREADVERKEALIRGMHARALHLYSEINPGMAIPGYDTL